MGPRGLEGPGGTGGLGGPWDEIRRALSVKRKVYEEKRSGVRPGKVVVGIDHVVFFQLF